MQHILIYGLVSCRCDCSFGLACLPPFSLAYPLFFFCPTPARIRTLGRVVVKIWVTGPLSALPPSLSLAPFRPRCLFAVSQFCTSIPHCHRDPAVVPITGLHAHPGFSEIPAQMQGSLLFLDRLLAGRFQLGLSANRKTTVKNTEGGLTVGDFG